MFNHGPFGTEAMVKFNVAGTGFSVIRRIIHKFSWHLCVSTFGTFSSTMRFFLTFLDSAISIYSRVALLYEVEIMFSFLGVTLSPRGSSATISAIAPVPDDG
jgi:hypothetical protein